MTFWKRFKNATYKNNYIKMLYDNPETVVDIEFYNKTDKVKKLWVEPSCEEIELESCTEYKIITHDKFLRFEYDSEDFIILYLQYSFGFKLYKRAYSKEIPNQLEWDLVFDNTDIN